jgi:hypothetical protein
MKATASPALRAEIEEALAYLNSPQSEREKLHIMERVAKYNRYTALLARVRKGEVANPNDSFDDTDNTIKPKAEKPEGSIRKSTGKQVKIFGEFAATAILRWMGANDWKFEPALLAIVTLGCPDLSESTVRIQLRAGKKGERGPIPTLTKSQVAQLKKASK